MGVVISKKPWSSMARRGRKPPRLRRTMFPFYLGIPQIQIAVLQPGVLPGLPRVVDLKGQLVVLAASQHPQLFRHHLDVAGGQLGVLAGTLPHRAGDGDNALLVERLHLGHHVLCLNDHLGHAVQVPQHQKAQAAAHLPQIFQPSRQGDGLAHVLHAQLPAGMGSVFCL